MGRSLAGLGSGQRRPWVAETPEGDFGARASAGLGQGAGGPEPRVSGGSQVTRAGMPYCGDHGKTWRSSARNPEVFAPSPSPLRGFYGNALSPRRRAAGTKKTGSKAARAVCACSVSTGARAAGRRRKTRRWGSWCGVQAPFTHADICTGRHVLST